MLSHGVVVVIVIFLSSTIALEQPLVRLKLGNIIGYHKKSYDGRTYSAFEGISYAKPPIGKLRFEPPAKSDFVRETLNTNKTYSCAQFSSYSKVMGTEDCLYLNVYVPREKANSREELDVIVYIHGGGYMGGNPKMGGPKFFMDREIVFVNLNYRVGVFGFLSTEDTVVPGNNGMKDQALALKWVRDNIKQFGGNPESITITGDSAGGSSVHLHYFSKLSKGLFHRGISQSGSALTPWTIQTGALERAKALGALVKCSDITNRELVDCLKEKSVEEILENVDHLNSPANGFPQPIFSPIVEKSSGTSFLDDYPYKLLLNKKFNDLPWITSICKDEGALALMFLYEDLENFDGKFDKWVHYYLDFNHTACEHDRKVIAEKVREEYFGNNKMGRDTYKNIIQLFGHRMFITASENASRTQASVANSNVYSYVYSYKNSYIDEYRQSMGIDLDLGVGHTEDSQLLYDVTLEDGINVNAILSKEDEILKNKMIDFYFSFANTSIPKIDGFMVQPVTNSKKITHLSIKSPNEIIMDAVLEYSPTKFWNSLPIVDLEKFPENFCEKQ